ncbi:LytTR family DNA-binding domain-containing protein [Mucilaginibacter sp. BJC16-A38]|uniref:LytR/AlgR family response regulator transcription factor n=1 Tax=Mucilaginibacter phenanthrenivorans TaxID=1234842 RepID=UPI002158350B|nr:LytTR family DNA-binding domain-containing protein [Mucilaginibacter phenanthrenivorans]MCR8560893.1 LytTR family DNA-binding domain-containing protein [Mucilaginibacter phenanthrenivorans]
MKIVIIEDEGVVADDLELNIRKLVDEPLDIVQIRSVKEGIAYFREADAPDLIFSDIQLGDGLSFEIFVSGPVTVPVIFCTAYDEYALDAFKANGIDYILKPFTRQMLDSALQKYRQLKKVFSTDQTPQFEALMQLLAGKETQKAASVLVYHQDKIIPVNLEDVAMFYLANEVTHMLTFSGKTLYPNKTLDELEKLSGNTFFRANRQFLVCRKAIIDVSSFFSRKLSLNLKVPFNEKVIVSKGKAAQFLSWLAKN